MKIFYLIIALIIFGISSFNIISTFIEHPDLTPYDKGSMVGNLLLLVTSLCFLVVQKKNKYL